MVVLISLVLIFRRVRLLSKLVDRIILDFALRLVKIAWWECNTQNVRIAHIVNSIQFSNGVSISSEVALL